MLSVSVFAAQFTLEGKAYQKRVDFLRASQRRMRNKALGNYTTWMVRQHQGHSEQHCVYMITLFAASVRD